MTDNEEAHIIVCGIAEACQGHRSHCVLMALSIIIGRFVAHGDEGSLPSLMKLIENAAAYEEAQHRAELAAKPAEHAVRVQ